MIECNVPGRPIGINVGFASEMDKVLPLGQVRREESQQAVSDFAEESWFRRGDETDLAMCRWRFLDTHAEI